MGSQLFAQNILLVPVSHIVFLSVNISATAVLTSSNKPAMGKALAVHNTERECCTNTFPRTTESVQLTTLNDAENTSYDGTSQRTFTWKVLDVDTAGCTVTKTYAEGTTIPCQSYRRHHV